jgi:hypothetical protein
MPVTSTGRWYGGAEVASRAAVGPKIYGSTTTETAFNIEDAMALMASVGAYSFYRSALTGSNNDFDLVAQTPGDQSGITIVLADPSANNASLSITVATLAITAHLATGSGGAITTTASQLVAAINASAAASALVVASLAPGNSGAGVVTALSSAPLVNDSGTSPTADVTLEASADGSTDYVTAVTIPQFTTAHAAYKRIAPVWPGGTARWKVTIGGSGTPLLAIGAVAQSMRAGA